MNLLVTPNMWGPISDEQVREYAEVRHSIFQCGHCSNEEAHVFHNLLGQHSHTPAAKLMSLIPEGVQ
jgi:hypothetical protein